jgi:aminoglycoside phosphotransferase family enzyme/predicted kinase
MVKMASQQALVLQVMGSPEVYGLANQTIERIDTHASVVFLAGDNAYKIKKKVKYPFLDFSSLEKRRLALVNELRLNRRTAPQIYLDLIPITSTEGGDVSLGGTGAVIEWALCMRRFDQDRLYDRMAAEGRLPLAAMPRLAAKIVELHRGADRTLTPEQAVLPLARIIEDNLVAFAGKDEIVPADIQAQLRDGSRSALAALAPSLEARARGGFVRHCHGDLHLRNIVEIEGEPVLFDALEFDDGLANIDVLYDLAFLLMDLGARGLVDHANALLNSYLETSGDTANLIALRALPLFLSMRAMIRAKVELLRADQGPKQGRDEARSRAHDYCLLARDYLEVRAPRLIAMGGLSGSGKSTVARMLAPRIGSFPGAVHIRSDVERKRMFGVPFEVKLPPSAYALEVTELVYAACGKRAALALEGGQTAIVDAVQAKEVEREALSALAAKMGVAFTGIWLEAPRAMLRQRVGTRKGDVSDAAPEIVDRQLAFDLGRQNFAVVDAGKPLEQVIRACLAKIGEQAPKTWQLHFGAGG